MTAPELDAAALDRLDSALDVREPFAGSTLDALIAQARLALAQAERIATLEAERDKWHGHWQGACSENYGLAAMVNALRDALESVPDWTRALGEHGPQIVIESEAAQDARWPHDPGFVTKLAEVMRVYADAMAHGQEKRHAALLAQTPAQSLAAHDAEVLERAITEITNRCVRQIGESTLIPGYNRCMDDVERAIERIRALAAQEVKP